MKKVYLTKSFWEKNKEWFDIIEHEKWENKFGIIPTYTMNIKHDEDYIALCLRFPKTKTVYERL